MPLNKSLGQGLTLKAWNFDTGAITGQTVAARGDSGDYEPIIHVERVLTPSAADRIVIKKSVCEQFGFLIEIEN